MKFKLDFDDEEARRWLDSIRQRAANPAPLMAAYANYGEQQTRATFAAERAPDGTAWKPSRRKELKGGKTLTGASGHLGDSVSSSYFNDSAEFGLGAMYAAMHQFGGTITPKDPNGFLKFRGAGGQFAAVRSATIPARPMLPSSLAELGEDELLNLTLTYLQD
jgi:phage gpG-like protein